MKDFLFSNVKHFRYERKFYIAGLTREEVEAIVKFHPAIFREIYQERRVNSIYFDSFNLQQYFDNINGVDRRLKIRIRWYGDLFGFIESPTLELKLKHNLHVGKLLYPLKSFMLDNNFSIDILRETFRNSSLGEELKMHLMEVFPYFLNTYTRKYFLSSDRNYRITVDTNMQAYRLLRYENNFLHKSTNHTHTILELKYNNPNDEFINTITNYFPFRMTRSSKYVDGIVQLYA